MGQKGQRRPFLQLEMSDEREKRLVGQTSGHPTGLPPAAVAEDAARGRHAHPLCRMLLNPSSHLGKVSVLSAQKSTFRKKCCLLPVLNCSLPGFTECPLGFMLQDVVTNIFAFQPLPSLVTRLYHSPVDFSQVSPSLHPC